MNIQFEKANNQISQRRLDEPKRDQHIDLSSLNLPDPSKENIVLTGNFGNQELENSLEKGFKITENKLSKQIEMFETSQLFAETQNFTASQIQTERYPTFQYQEVNANQQDDTSSDIEILFTKNAQHKSKTQDLFSCITNNSNHRIQ